MKEFELTTEFDFGKFKGEILKDVIDFISDESQNKYDNYIMWCVNKKIISLSEQAREYIAESFFKWRRAHPTLYPEHSSKSYYGDYGQSSCPGDYMGMGPADFGVPNC